MIGDKLSDLECGWNAAVKNSFLVRTGYGAMTEKTFVEKIQKAAVADSLKEAVQWILDAKSNSATSGKAGGLR